MIALGFIIGYTNILLSLEHYNEQLWVCYGMHAVTSGAPFIQKNEKICSFSMP